jgi:hypothetical protein
MSRREFSSHDALVTLVGCLRGRCASECCKERAPRVQARHAGACSSDQGTAPYVCTVSLAVESRWRCVELSGPFAEYRGAVHPLKGDEPSRRVRDAAKVRL